MPPSSYPTVCNARTPVPVLAALLPANAPERTVEDAQVSAGLGLLCKTQIKFQAPVFNWLILDCCCHLESKLRDERYLSPSLSVVLSFQSIYKPFVFKSGFQEDN